MTFPELKKGFIDKFDQKVDIEMEDGKKISAVLRWSYSQEESDSGDYEIGVDDKDGYYSRIPLSKIRSMAVA